MGPAGQRQALDHPPPIHLNSVLQSLDSISPVGPLSAPKPGVTLDDEAGRLAGEAGPDRGARISQIRAHLEDPMYRTGYLLMAGTAVSALFGFLFWTVTARLFSAHDVGISSSAIAAMTFVAALCDLGLNNILTRYVPAAGSARRSVVLASYAASFAVCAVIGTTAALTSPLWSSSLAFIGHDPWWSFAFIGSVAAWAIFGLQDSVLTATRATHIVPLEALAYAVGKVVLLFPLAWLLPHLGPFIAWTVPTPFGIAIISWIIFKKVMPRRRANAAADEPRLPGRRVIVQSVSASFLGSIFLTAAWFLTPVIVADLVGPDKEAYFYVPFTFLVALNSLTVNTMTALTVEAAMDEDQIFPLARRSLLNSWALLAPVVLVLVVGAPLILDLYGSAYAHAGASLMRLLALSLFPSAITSIGIAVARIQNRNGWVLWIQAVPSLVQVGMTIVLVRGGSIAGAGWAQLIADGFGAVVVCVGLLSPLLLARRGALSA
jgi:O-antigen/teichoic acid export membrane protein